MEKNARIYVAGHRGLAGSAIVRRLKAEGYNNLLLRTHGELDLTAQDASSAFMAREKPDYVFLAAARVGGIHANNTYRADFIYNNLSIQNNIIHACWQNKVKRLIFLGSSCIYPKDCPQPMREEHLLIGPLEPTNLPYAIAKIAGVEMCRAFNRQYGTHFLSLMPTNLYGPGDNYDLQNSHVLPALIHKIHTAKQQQASEYVLWGTGTPRREFLYVDDLAAASVFLANLPEADFLELLQHPVAPALINVGYGSDLTIEELAHSVSKVIGFSGNIVKDASKPDGTLLKLLDSSRLRALGWRPQYSLEQGIALAYQAFLAEFPIAKSAA